MINVIGSITGTSGYDNHTKGLVNALNKLTPVKITTNLQPGWEHLVNDKELEMVKRQDDLEINLIITHPMFWRVNCQAKRNWVYLIWEGDSVPGWIVDECMNPNIEKIICPSEHTKSALIQTWETPHPELIDKIVAISHGVDLNIFKPSNNIIPVDSKESAEEGVTAPFKFLANKGFRNLEDRGGIQYLVKAFAEEFKPDEKVELIIKINPAYGVPDFNQFFPNLKSAPIKVIGDNYTLKQLNNLYNECDVFVSPTRAEAFNLPCLEALACGKPVITTNFGGQTDFCSDETGWMIDYDLVEVEHELEYEGVKWATPDHNKLKEALRQAFNDKATCKSLGETGIQTAKQFTWDNTAKKIHELL